MSDLVYKRHIHWIRLYSRYFHRVEHRGYVEECLRVARKEHVIFISNHAIIMEATILDGFLLDNGAGQVSTLVFREAFKIPLVREFLRSCQCVPISVESGAAALQKRHILIFPEGMDFISSFINPDRVPAFHKGFLRMAKLYLKNSNKRSVAVIPVAHAGLEEAVKIWVIKNRLIMNKIVHRFINYPYIVFPKIPFLLPTKVFFHWGIPTRLTLDDLRTERKISMTMNKLRASLISQRLWTEEARDTAWV